MTILGIDTTTRSGSIALVNEGRLLGGLQVTGRPDHSEQVLLSVSYLLSRLGLTKGDLRAVGVSVGPGSFTGVRVGLASAGGLSRGLDVPALGLCSLEALALGVSASRPGSWICPWLDAGRGEVYAAAYQAPGEPGNLRTMRQPAMAHPEVWLEGLPAAAVRFLGDGASLHGELLRKRYGAGCLEQPEGPWFLAASLALWAERRLRSGVPDSLAILEPLYLRPTDAEQRRRNKP
jgi:tRNA threonylcarbamoyladenosine biosynthesis protein TsaB